MPTYVYLCSKCNKKKEAVYRMKDKPQTIPCDCGEAMISVPCCSAIQGDEPVWLNNDVRMAIQGEKEMRTHPITSRTEYNKALKDKGLIAAG